MAIFVRVVEARSFTAAATALGLSKSVVSTRVAQLERMLGVRLLHRTTRKIALTAEGVRLYERCARALSDAEEAAEAVAGASENPRGLLRVAAPTSLGSAFVAAAVTAFLAEFPDVRVELRFDDRLTDPLEAELDVVLRVAARLPDSPLIAKRLASDRLVLCAAPTYLRTRGIPWRDAELVHHDLLLLSTAAYGERGLWPFESHGMGSPPRLTSDDALFLRRAALEGGGIATLPSSLVAPDLVSGRLRPVLEEIERPDLGVYAVTAHRGLVPAKVRVFLEHLVRRFRLPPWRRPLRPRRLAGILEASAS
ncbi:Transcriptional regulator, LysR family [Labilithrix luteola]|uniref:Transcriptional regulator, LysR family n=2 Tax=Labilithrix luteola TaxID=1391654 RepID=A0A0K1QD59_9BACT|nr:Transcriptional regulator, LysR family [Labilithrix luteola]